LRHHRADLVVAVGKIDHFELEVRLALHAREKSATVLDLGRSAPVALVGTACTTHDIDRSEMMAPADFVGQHAAEAPVIELQIRLLLGTARIERCSRTASRRR
jgi:hypothetical protein